MTAPRFAFRPTRTVAAAAALLVLTAVGLGAPATAAAVCNVTSACSAAGFLASAACCNATSCTIDANVTVPVGPTCGEWDFGSRNVTLSATTTLGTASLTLRTTGMVMVAGSAKLLSTTGSVSILADGAVTLDSGTLIESTASGDIEVEGASVTALGRMITDAGLGAISLTALTGAITVNRSSNEGLSAREGSLVLQTDTARPGTDITVNTPVGIEGGDVEIEGGGKIEIQRTLEVGNYLDGGGDISITSWLNDILITGQGRLLGTSDSYGGTATLDAARDVVVRNNIELRGTRGASGGELTVNAGRDTLFELSANVDVSGTAGSGDSSGEFGDGGIVDVAAGRDISLATNTRIFGNAGGSGTSGGIGGNVSLDAGSILYGQPAPAGNLTINGRIIANGRSTLGNYVSLGGCQVTIASGALVDALGDTQSETVVIARTGLTVAGQIRSNLRNVVELPIGGAFPAGGTITPAAVAGECVDGTASGNACRRAVCVAEDDPVGCLTPCPTCGDGQTVWPEECDGAGANRCDTGCSPSCRDESCGDDNACTEYACDPAGGCYIVGLVPNGTPCDDATVCDGREECRLGVCQVITGSVPTCGEDGNPCTQHGCDAVTGCIQTPTPGPDVPGCDDGNACTGDEICSAQGVCLPGELVTCDPGDVCNVGTGVCGPSDPCSGPADCNDSNPCTTDTCNGEQRCVNTIVAGSGVAGCDDGNACNGVETCTAGVCVLMTPPVCDDGDPCTTESCDPAEGCVDPTPIPNCCEAPADCADDGNACTANTCVDRQCGSQDVPQCCLGDAECDDGNACTPGGSCVDNQCTSTPPPDCEDDGDLCTDDFCDPVAGCVHAEIPGCCSSNAECDDGTACTTDTCDPVFHVCSNVQEDDLCVACDETDVFSCSPMGACAAVECVAGACAPRQAPDCDDGDDCTDDSCVAAEGCRNLLRSEDPECTSIPCADDAECADTNLCTVDTCDASGTCRQTPSEGTAAVECRLAGCDAVLAGAGDDLVTKKARRVVTGKLKAVRKRMTVAETKLGQGKTKPAAKAYKVAGSLLTKLGKYVNKQRGKAIDSSVADELARLVSEAKSAVDAVRAGVLGS